MAVEKLSDCSRSILERNPFSQISNEIIEHIKDNDAFRLYCFLYSKSRDWNVIKSYASQICDVRETKSKKCWSYLARCGLIEYRVVKDDKGKIIKHDLIILNGTRFDKDEPFINLESNQEKLSTLHRVKNPPTGQSTRMEKRPLLNKDNKKERLKEKNKDFISNSTSSFEHQKRKEPPRYPNKEPTTYHDRCTVSDEFKSKQHVDTRSTVGMRSIKDIVKKLGSPKSGTDVQNEDISKNPKYQLG